MSIIHTSQQPTDQPKGNIMTLQEATQISKAAKAKGYGTRIMGGKMQFVVVSYALNGKSKLIAKSEYVSLDDALEVLNNLPVAN
jgi:hypothetical protein